jgi:hypothetical protein
MKENDPRLAAADPPPCPPPDTRRAGYMRLAQTVGGPYSADSIGRLADIMKDSDEKRRARGTRIRTMPSGYVYLGQFIDHDLTRNPTGIAEEASNVCQIPNVRIPRLDLDHLYGESRAAAPCLYDAQGYLQLGETSPSASPPRFDDLHRAPDGTAIVIDPRNDENLILAQMHVLWSKFHNSLLALIGDDQQIAEGVPGSDDFERTQNLVRWHYQWIVWSDFLPHIGQTAIWAKVANGELRLFPGRYSPADDPMALPVEFIMAAFRFGHSMVQQNYRISSSVFLPISEILRLTKNGGGISDKLPASAVVDWKYFFVNPEGEASLNRGESIDTFVTEALSALSLPTVAVFLLMMRGGRSTGGASAARTLCGPCLGPKGDTVSLPCMTLTRGSSTCLPSGEDFAREFRYEPLSPSDIYALPEDKPFFESDEMQGRTPLWYYLLREAAVEKKMEPATDNDPIPIQKLGSIGSQILAETFYQVLSADGNSIFNAGKRWEPPFIEASNGQPFRIRSMMDLVAFVRGVTALEN